MTAEMVTREYEPDRGGVIRYLDAGARFVKESRRSNALQQIEEFCGGAYTITKESKDSSEETIVMLPNTATGGYVGVAGSSPYLHIYFTCDEKDGEED